MVISGTSIRRSQAVQGQSPLYYFIAWATRHVSGRSEFGFRLPSLIFAGIAAYLVFRIAHAFGRRGDRQDRGGRIRHAANDRVRGFGCAALRSRDPAGRRLDMGAHRLAGLRSLVGWTLLRGPRFRRPLRPPALRHGPDPQLAYALIRSREGSTAVRLRGLVFAAGGIVLLVVPVGIELMMLWGRHEDWSIPNPVTVPWVTQMLPPPALLAAVAVGRPNHLPNLSVPLADRVPPRSALLLLLGLGWSRRDPGRLLSRITGPARRATRTSCNRGPRPAIAFRGALRRVEPAQARRAIIAVFVILSILELASPYKSGDFRGAATLVRGTATQDTTVFIASGFQESLQRDSVHRFRATRPSHSSRLPSTRCLGTSFHFRSSSTHPHKHWSPSSSLRGSATAQSVVTVTPTDAAYVVWLDRIHAGSRLTSHHIGDVQSLRGEPVHALAASQHLRSEPQPFAPRRKTKR